MGLSYGGGGVSGWVSELLVRLGVNSNYSGYRTTVLLGVRSTGTQADGRLKVLQRRLFINRELIAAHPFFIKAHQATILVSPVGQSVAPVAYLVP